jgi:hypothetical protein
VRQIHELAMMLCSHDSNPLGERLDPNDWHCSCSCLLLMKCTMLCVICSPHLPGWVVADHTPTTTASVDESSMFRDLGIWYACRR